MNAEELKQKISVIISNQTITGNEKRDEILGLISYVKRYDEDDLRYVFECFDQGDRFDKQLANYNAPI